MLDETIRIGREIIESLEEKGFELDGGLKNSIILLVAEAFETGREQGIKEGTGKAIDDLEKKLYDMRDKLILG